MTTSTTDLHLSTWRLAARRKPKPTETNSTSVLITSLIRTPSLTDLFEKRTKAKGVAPGACIHHGMTVSMYYADPDGNQMEFQVDAFDSSEEANAFMSGPITPETPSVSSTNRKNGSPVCAREHRRRNS
jgi:hypothetical protein